MTIRGVEHIGITVPDIAEAEQFFINALDATVLYRIVPNNDADKSISGDQLTTVNGFPADMRITGLSMLRLKNGCNIELFQVLPRPAVKSSSIGHEGISHFSVYVDDIQAAAQRLKAHGAQFFDGPGDCFAQETGQGNQTWFCRAPFGVLIELITLTSAIQYDPQATQTRWIPAGDN